MGGGFNPLFIGARLLIYRRREKRKKMGKCFNPLFIGARLLMIREGIEERREG